MLIVFDVGTTALKGAVFSRDGNLLARTSVPLSLLQTPDALQHECDARQWASALRHAAESLGRAVASQGDCAATQSQAVGAGFRPEAVVVSGNGPTLVPVDARGDPMAPALTWMDRRAMDEAAAVSECAGHPVDPSFYLPKALWFFRRFPEVYRQTRFFFSCPEYLEYLLTGEAVTFLPAPQFTGYIWDAPIISRLGMDPSRFPPFVPCGRVIGAVSEEGQRRFGIPRGTPVVSGGPDFVVSLLGTATVRPGRACIRSGTSEGVNLCSAVAVADRRLLSLGHVIQPLYNISGTISTSGKALEWIKRITGRETMDYESLFRQVAGVPAGSQGLVFLPYLAGERAPIWDPHARGTFIGLTLSHGVPEMTRAVVESVGMAIRDVLEVMEEQGLVVEDLRITGMPSRSAVWNQVKADITGHRILVPAVADSDLSGDASLARYALGDYPTLAQAAEAMIGIGATYEPDPGRHSRYDDLFLAYRQAYQSLKPLFPKLSTARSPS